MRRLPIILIVALLSVAAAVGIWLMQGRGPTAADPGGNRTGSATAADTDPGAGDSDASAGPGGSRVPVERGVGPAGEAGGVTCLVVDSRGEPAPSVRIKLFRAVGVWPDVQREELEVGWTGPDGRCEFRTAPQAGLLVVASQRDFARTAVDASWVRGDVLLRLTEAFEVYGKVETYDGSTPTARCEVLLEPAAGSDRKARRTHTDSYGGFRFEDVMAGPARLTVRHPGLQPVTKQITIGRSVGETLVLPRARELVVRGRAIALGDDGQGVADARVQAYPSSWNSKLFLPVETRTDADGEFELGGLGPGNLRVVIRHPAYSSAEQVVRVRAEMAAMRVELAGRSRVRGRLVGERIPAGVALMVHQVNDDAQRVAIEPDGTFEFAHTLSAGFADLRLLLPPDVDPICFASTSRDRMRVTIPEADETELELDVQPAARILGQVVDAAGQPIAAVQISRPVGRALGSPLEVLTATDQEGRFRVAGLAGTVMLVIRHERYAALEFEVETPAPGESLQLERIELSAPGQIRGRVRRDGRGVGGALVFVRTGRFGVVHDVSGSDGRYALRGLPAGRFRVRAVYGSMPLVDTDGRVQLAAGSVVDGIDVDLRAGRQIRGEIVTPSGAPIAGALVSLSGRQRRHFRADAEGRFAIEVDRDEAVDLVVMLQSTAAIRKRVRYGVDDDFKAIVLDTVPAGVLRLQLLGMPGRVPLTAAVVRFEPAASMRPDVVPQHRRQRIEPSRWVTAQGGWLTLDRFPAGESNLVVHSPGFMPWSGSVVVSPNATTDLGEVLVERGAKVRGRVFGPDGEAVAGAAVMVGQLIDLVAADRGETGPRGSLLHTNRDGEFALEGIGADAHQLVVSAPGFAPAVVGLRIPSDLMRRDPLRVELSRGVELSIQVRSPSAAVELSSVVLRRDGAVFDVIPTDEEGVATFRNLPDGEYSALVLGVGVPPRRIRIALAEASERRIVFDIPESVR